MFDTALRSIRRLGSELRSYEQLDVILVAWCTPVQYRLDEGRHDPLHISLSTTPPMVTVYHIAYMIRMRIRRESCTHH